MISIIIPTLNAAPHLPSALAPLVAPTADGLVKQVIVADGGSADETLEIADAAGCDVVVASRGRGAQLRAGAAKTMARPPVDKLAPTNTTASVSWGEFTQVYGGNVDIELPDEGWLTIQAANGESPNVRLVGVSSLSVPTGTATLILDGLLIEGAFELNGGLALTLQHCTLVPWLACLSRASRQ